MSRKLRKARNVFRLILWSLKTGLAAVFLGAILWALFFSPYVAIDGIVISGTDDVSLNAVHVKSEEVLKRPLFLFVKQNALFFSKGALSSELKNAFPKIAAVEVSSDIPDRKIHVRVWERISQGIWCAVAFEKIREEEGAVEAKESVVERIEECFFIDGEGVAFEQAPKTRGGLILVLKEVRRQVPSLGDVAVDPAFLSILAEAREDLPISVEEFQLRSAQDFRMKTVEGWEVLLTRDRPLKEQMLILKEVLRKEIPSEQRKHLEYIDLRIPNRAYYR